MLYQNHMMRTVGSRVRRAREARDRMTQNALAKAVGTDQGSIHRIESDKMRGQKHMPRIAAVLGVDLQWLMTGDNPPRHLRENVTEPPAAYSPGHGTAGMLERIATALERISDTIQVIDRRLLEKAIHDEARDEDRAETRRVLDQWRESGQLPPPKAAEP